MKRSFGRVCLLVSTLAGVCLSPADGLASVAREVVDCGRADTLCVDVVDGSRQEFSTIQAAVKRARAGDTVVVFPGGYAGFHVSRSGKAKRRITVSGRPGTRSTSSERRSDDGIYLANAGSDNTVLRGNACYGNAINGIHFNGDARYGGDGVHMGLVVNGNVLFDNGANGFAADGVRSSSFVNNVVYDNGGHGLRVKVCRKKLFTKPNKADFTLKAGSPAVDAGATSLAGQDAPGRGINGARQPRGDAVDLGAYQRAADSER